MLFRQHDGHSLQNFFSVSLKGGKEDTISINNDEAELLIVLEECLEGFSVEPVLALVDELLLRDERFEIDRNFFLSFPVFEEDYTAEKN